ncbi:MAG TPA: GYD domain-containing protein [Thermoplasmata archaeon]|nr:GYD domain-containing protein [Thermoplasmata archaeon]
MVQFAYSPQAWQALIQKPEDRTAALEAMAKQFGGRLIALYYHPGKFDGFVLLEAPDDTTVNATVMAVQAAGGVATTRTTKLFSPKEFVDALGRASKVAYRAPGKK